MRHPAGQEPPRHPAHGLCATQLTQRIPKYGGSTQAKLHIRFLQAAESYEDRQNSLSIEKWVECGVYFSILYLGTCAHIITSGCTVLLLCAGQCFFFVDRGALNWNHLCWLMFNIALQLRVSSSKTLNILHFSTDILLHTTVICCWWTTLKNKVYSTIIQLAAISSFSITKSFEVASEAVARAM